MDVRNIGDIFLIPRLEGQKVLIKEGIDTVVISKDTVVSYQKMLDSLEKIQIEERNKIMYYDSICSSLQIKLDETKGLKKKQKTQQELMKNILIKNAIERGYERMKEDIAKNVK